MANPDYILPGIAGVTALATGFGAAALKHRWDVQDDERRWERERAERRREELKSEFNDFLAARGTLVTLMTKPFPESTPFDRAIEILGEATRAAFQLQVSIGEEDGAVIESDLRAIQLWLKAMFARPVGQASDFPVAPKDLAVRQLAKRLLDP